MGSQVDLAEGLRRTWAWIHRIEEATRDDSYGDGNHVTTASIIIPVFNQSP
jgi:hypothetical protein